jgi:4-hydroxybenzoyl-CoA thioesterase
VPFSTSITVAFGDTDPAGLVYYPNLFHYCHIAMERFFKAQADATYHDLIAKQRIGFPAVKIETEFARPLIYGDEVEITVDVVNLGQRSLTLSYRLYRVADGAQCAQMTMVHVAMNLVSKTSLEIPETLRKKLGEALRSS